MTTLAQSEPALADFPSLVDYCSTPDACARCGEIRAAKASGTFLAPRKGW